MLIMIEKIKILEIVSNALEGSDKFLVNLKITPDNRIYVDIDGEKLEGELTAADDESINLHIAGSKKKAPEDINLKRKDLKSVRVALKF